MSWILGFSSEGSGIIIPFFRTSKDLLEHQFFFFKKLIKNLNFIDNIKKETSGGQDIHYEGE